MKGTKKAPTRKIPTHETPPWKIPTRNIPTYVFEHSHSSFWIFCFFIIVTVILILLKRLLSNFVLKVLRSEIRKSMYQKNCSLPAQVWWSVTIIIHLFVLDDFIFEASHEECDVTKFNQLNGAAWILPGELSSLNQPTLDWKLKND